MERCPDLISVAQIKTMSADWIIRAFGSFFLSLTFLRDVEREGGDGSKNPRIPQSCGVFLAPPGLWESGDMTSGSALDCALYASLSSTF